MIARQFVNAVERARRSPKHRRERADARDLARAVIKGSQRLFNAVVVERYDQSTYTFTDGSCASVRLASCKVLELEPA